MAESSDLNSAHLNRAASIEEALAAGATARSASQRNRMRKSLAVSAGITTVWFVSVASLGLWSRVGEHWVAALTMVFGSFVAGATPQGGGAVAFPVFTKLLDVPAEVARSFSLCIQAVGMGTATLSIIINRRPVEWRAAATGGAVGSLAFIASLFAFGDRDAAFWPIDLPGPYIKVTFTLVVLAMGVVVVIGSRIPIRSVSAALPPLNHRLRIALVVSAVLGGVASAFVGSGADVMVYLFVVVLFGVRAEVGVPTSVVTMAMVSIVGFVVLGLFDGQLSVDLDAAGQVVAVGGTALAQPTPQRQADLFGMWLAAAPVVAWGAPFGAFVASRLTTAALVRLAIVLSIGEVVSTLLFLEPLRSDRGLQVFAVVGALASVSALTVVAARRRRLFGLPDLALSTQLTRSTTEVSSNYRQEF